MIKPLNISGNHFNYSTPHMNVTSVEVLVSISIDSQRSWGNIPEILITSRTFSDVWEVTEFTSRGAEIFRGPRFF